MAKTPQLSNNKSPVFMIEWQKLKYNLNFFINLYVNIQMRLYRDFDSIVQELNYLSLPQLINISYFLHYRINKKKKKKNDVFITES